MTRAYSYLRFSTPEQARGDSARRQTDLAASYAARHGLELDEKLTFEDTGVSAYRGRNVAEGRLADFLAAVRSGVVERGSYLLVENLDRISRQTLMRALDTLRELVDAGVTVVTLTDEARYNKESIEREPMQLLVAVLTFARANEESAMKGRRVRAAWDRKKQEAAQKPLTKVCPAWLRMKEDRSGFEVIPERGDIVRRVFELTAAGVGQNSIAATLNREGVPTFGDERRKAGAHWHRTYIAKMLASDAPLGTYVPHSGSYQDGKFVRTPWDPVPNYYPAVVDPETVRRARLVMGPGSNPKRGRHANRAVLNVLAGLARCPLCEGTMTRVSKGSRAKAGKPYLVCAKAKAGAGCRYRAVPYQPVEDTLRDKAEELVYKDTLEDRDRELDLLIERRDDLRKRVARLLDLVEQGSGSLAAVTRLGSLEAEQRDLDARIAARTAHLDNTREPLVERRMEDLREALMANPFDVERANAVLRLCASAVEVDYMSGHLFVGWRHGGVTDLLFAWPEEFSDAAE
jgi:DNA invertase Pin-like site-specific DNA recombinase